MSVLVPNAGASVVASATTTSALIATLDPTLRYELTAVAAIWIAQAPTTPTAAASSGSIYVPANATITLHGAMGIKVAAIAATGTATVVTCPVQSR